MPTLGEWKTQINGVDDVTLTAIDKDLFAQVVWKAAIEDEELFMAVVGEAAFFLEMLSGIDFDTANNQIIIGDTAIDLTTFMIRTYNAYGDIVDEYLLSEVFLNLKNEFRGEDLWLSDEEKLIISIDGKASIEKYEWDYDENDTVLASTTSINFDIG